MIEHGTPSRYTHHRCRCPKCRSAHNDAEKDRIKRHGRALRAWNVYFSEPCGVCGKRITTRDAEAARTRKFCSQECSYKGRQLKATFQAGDKHPAWIDGNARNGYTKEFSACLKRKIVARDGYACQLCGMTEAEHIARYNRKLCVNHIDFDKTNCDETNLNAMCIGCNTKINWNRPYWTSYFRRASG